MPTLKNALKGVGFFLGGALLTTIGFQSAMLAMAAGLALVWLASVTFLKRDLGRAKAKPKFRELLSKSRAINLLSAARLFLFGARDVWFVVALPVFLADRLGWDFWKIGGFLAAWVIGYGIVQSAAPWLTSPDRATVPDGRSAMLWAVLLAFVPAGIAASLATGLDPSTTLVAGLAVFGIAFAVNSSLHSFLIVSYAKADGVSLDVGFYYMANACGRLLGTILSGWIYQVAGIEACLVISSIFVVMAALFSIALPRRSRTTA